MVDTSQAGLDVVMGNCCKDGRGIAGLQPASAASKTSELQKVLLKQKQSTAVYNYKKTMGRIPYEEPDGNVVTVKELQRTVR